MVFESGAKLKEPERWLPIKNFPSYEISCYGNIRWANRNYGSLPIRINKRYLVVILQNGFYDKTRTVHSLVYQMFVGDIPKGYTIHHKDGNRYNNYYKNLQLMTYKEHEALHRNGFSMTEDAIVQYKKALLYWRQNAREISY